MYGGDSIDYNLFNTNRFQFYDDFKNEWLYLYQSFSFSEKVFLYMTEHFQLEIMKNVINISNLKISKLFDDGHIISNNLVTEFDFCC